MSDQTYLGNGKHEFEAVVETTDNAVVSRLRVPGGWLYVIYDPETGEHTPTFVPMPEVVKHKV